MVRKVREPDWLRSRHNTDLANEIHRPRPTIIATYTFSTSLSFVLLVFVEVQDNKLELKSG